MTRLTTTGLGIGTVGAAPGVRLVVSLNSTAPPTAAASSTVQIVGADSAGNRLSLDSFVANNTIIGRRANTSAAAPSALADLDNIVSFQGFGHDGVAYSSTANISINFLAAGAWTVSNRGTYMTFSSTTTGTTGGAERMRIDNAGGVNIGGLANAAATALLELTSTTRGLLLPRMTTTERNAISSPPDGMLIFNSTNLQVEARQTSAWWPVGSAYMNATAPASPSAGSMWWDSTNGILKIYYNDGSTSQWVDATPAGLSGFSGASPGASGFSGYSSVTAGASGFSGFSGKPVTSGIVALDFGTTAVYAKQFSTSVAAVLTTSNIMIQASPSTASSALGGDELEMDGFDVSAYCLVNGTMIIYVVATPGPIKGIRNFIYQIT